MEHDGVYVDQIFLITILSFRVLASGKYVAASVHCEDMAGFAPSSSHTWCVVTHLVTITQLLLMILCRQLHKKVAEDQISPSETLSEA